MATKRKRNRKRTRMATKRKRPKRVQLADRFRKLFKSLYTPASWEQKYWRLVKVKVGKRPSVWRDKGTNRFWIRVSRNWDRLVAELGFTFLGAFLLDAKRKGTYDGCQLWRITTVNSPFSLLPVIYSHDYVRLAGFFVRVRDDWYIYEAVAQAKELVAERLAGMEG